MLAKLLKTEAGSEVILVTPDVTDLWGLSSFPDRYNRVRFILPGGKQLGGVWLRRVVDPLVQILN